MAALDKLTADGYDPEMGRVIQNMVQDPLSDKLLSNEFKTGDTIMVDLDDDGNVILKQAEGEAKEVEPMGVG